MQIISMWGILMGEVNTHLQRVLNPRTGTGECPHESEGIRERYTIHGGNTHLQTHFWVRLTC